MNTMHTPGPWFLDDAQPGDRFRYVMAGKGDAFGYICRISTNGNANPEADARLIAAAPELLEAAQLVLAWYEAENDHSKADFYQRMQMCRDSEDAVRAAIARATGETP